MRMLERQTDSAYQSYYRLLCTQAAVDWDSAEHRNLIPLTESYHRQQDQKTCP